MQNKTVGYYADQLLKRLKKEGFKILKYNAVTTRSIYLKLDYGVCNSIRVSDHDGKQHLAYRYTLRLDTVGKSERVGNGGYPMYVYGPDAVEDLTQDILKSRQTKLDEYGEIRYQQFMESNKKENQHNKGFWKNAKEV